MRAAFPDYEYVSLEEPDRRDFAHTDPQHFLSIYGKRVILDEVQNEQGRFLAEKMEKRAVIAIKETYQQSLFISPLLNLMVDHRPLLFREVLYAGYFLKI